MSGAIMEVELSAFRHNINEIKKFLNKNKTIMPVVKANGYGTYLNKRLDILNEFEIVAVAMVSEAEEIRDLGYKKEIFVLNQPLIDDIDTISKKEITIGLSSKEFLEEAIKRNLKIKVHLEIETGMGRTGIYLDELEDFINKIKNSPNIEVEGVYTHFSSADDNPEFTKFQIEKFNKAVRNCKKTFW